MSEDRKKSFGMGMPEVKEGYRPQPLFPSRDAVARPEVARPVVAPLFSGGTMGKIADPGTVPPPKPLMAQAIVRVRVMATVENLLRSNPGVPPEICHAAKRLIEVTRLESEFVEGTVANWGAEAMDRMTALTTQSKRLMADPLYGQVTGNLQRLAVTLEEFVVQHLQPTRKRFLTAWRTSDARREAFEREYVAVEAQLQRLAEDGRRLQARQIEFQSLSRACEICIEEPTAMEVAGRYLVQVLRSRSSEPHESPEFAARLEERITRLGTAKQELRSALRSVWLRQEVMSKYIEQIRSLVSEMPTWKEQCLADVNGSALVSSREELASVAQERTSSIRILTTTEEES